MEALERQSPGPRQRWGTPEHPWSEWLATPEGRAWVKSTGPAKPITDPVALAKIAAILGEVKS